MKIFSIFILCLLILCPTIWGKSQKSCYVTFFAGPLFGGTNSSFDNITIHENASGFRGCILLEFLMKQYDQTIFLTYEISQYNPSFGGITTTSTTHYFGFDLKFGL